MAWTLSLEEKKNTDIKQEGKDRSRKSLRQFLYFVGADRTNKNSKSHHKTQLPSSLCSVTHRAQQGILLLWCQPPCWLLCFCVWLLVHYALTQTSHGSGHPHLPPYRCVNKCKCRFTVAADPKTFSLFPVLSLFIPFFPLMHPPHSHPCTWRGQGVSAPLTLTWMGFSEHERTHTIY